MGSALFFSFLMPPHFVVWVAITVVTPNSIIYGVIQYWQKLKTHGFVVVATYEPQQCEVQNLKSVFLRLDTTLLRTNGVSPNGKAQGFGSCMCWFESNYPSYSLNFGILELGKEIVKNKKKMQNRGINGR